MGPWTGPALSKLRSPRGPFLGSTPPAGAQPSQDGVTPGTWDHTRSQDQEAHQSQEARGRKGQGPGIQGLCWLCADKGPSCGWGGSSGLPTCIPTTWSVALGASVSSTHVGLHCPCAQGWVTGSEPQSPFWKWGEPFLWQG